MSKDNLVFGLGGVILGIIVGVLIANFSGGSRNQGGFAQKMTPAQQAPQMQSQG